MKVGDLVLDIPAKDYGIILELYPSWTTEDGQTYTWDIMIFSDGEVFFMDNDEVKVLENEDY